MTDSPSHFKLANIAFRAKDYALAVELYETALAEEPSVADSIRFNLELARSRISTASQHSTQQILRIDSQDNKVSDTGDVSSTEIEQTSDRTNLSSEASAGKCLEIKKRGDILENGVLSCNADKYKRTIHELALITQSHYFLEENGHLGIFGKSKTVYNEQVYTKIAESKLFDQAWYIDTYPDVALSQIDPVKHYMSIG
ncbi:tetratricopeptide repeat protein [Pseudomonas sp. NY11382]|nr:tetratricopeptide repeat protein [Pseudomonas sp. NY11382]WBM34203.1 tetratricopeptide repeat protein [Pseudomonas sp. NY11382]